MDDFYSLGLLLNRASVSLSKMLNNETLNNGINLPHSQFIVLRCLFYNDGISQQEIANLLFKDAAAIKRTIDNLEKKNLVIRRQARPQKNSVHISEKGKTLIPSVLKIADEVIAEATKGIEFNNYKLLREMLISIYTNTETK